MPRNLKRHGIVPLEEVLPYIAVGATPNCRDKRREYHGFNVKVCSLRLQCFAVHGVDCAGCGVKGSFFALEQPADAGHPHLNLYALSNGKEILMTLDHIFCKAAGGPNIIENSQTMCEFCNIAKGASVDSDYYKKFKEQMEQNGRAVRTNPTFDSTPNNILRALADWNLL